MYVLYSAVSIANRFLIFMKITRMYCISDLQMVVRNWRTHHSLFSHDQV